MLSTGCWFSDQRPFFLHPDWLFLRSLQEQLPKERIPKDKKITKQRRELKAVKQSRKPARKRNVAKITCCAVLAQYGGEIPPEDGEAHGRKYSYISEEELYA